MRNKGHKVSRRIVDPGRAQKALIIRLDKRSD